MQRLSIILFGILCAVWILTGGVHWGTALLLTALAVFGGISAMIYGIIQSRRRRNGAVTGRAEFCAASFHGFGISGWILIAMMAACILSLIPMPLGVLDIVSPRAAELYAESWSLAGVDRGWGFLSAAPGRTAFGLIHLCGFFGLYLICLRFGGRRRSVQVLSHIFLAAGSLWILLFCLEFAGIHVSVGAAGAESAWHIGLPVNENHMSGVLVMLSLMSLCSFLSRRHRDAEARRGLWALFYIMFGVMILMIGSRGAISAWLAGHLLTAVFVYSRAHQLSLRAGGLIIGALAVVAAAALVVSAPSISAVTDEFAETQIAFSVDAGTDIPHKTFSKTQLYGDFSGMSKDWIAAGTGRSAFADIYPAYQSFPYPKHFRHAENEFWEWILEFGWIFGIAVIAAVIFAIVRFLCVYWKEQNERFVVTGWLVGIIAVLIQSIFDFGLRYWTVGFAVWAACGMLQARAYRWKFGRLGQDPQEISRRLRVEYMAGCIIFAGAIITSAVYLSPAVESQTESRLDDLPVNLARAELQCSGPELLRQLTIRPASEIVRAMVGRCYVERGTRDPKKRLESWQTARRWYESASKRAPHSAEISLRLGKLCRALGDGTCAVDNYLKTARDDPRKQTLAMRELSALPASVIRLPENAASRRALIIGLIEENRSDDALAFIDQLDDPEMAVDLRVDLYRRIGFEEAIPGTVETLASRPMTTTRLRLETEVLIRSGRIEEMLERVESAESVLRHDPDYWRLRLYRCVWFGGKRGESWYRSQIPELFLEVRRFSAQSAGWRYDIALCDAKFAFETGRISRAIRSARQALDLRSGSREAQRILDAAQKQLNRKHKFNY